MPFSPWNKDTNTIYISILPYLHGDAGRIENNKTISLNTLQILVHEISHFIFLDIIAHSHIALPHVNHQTIIYFAQEILAPVVMNQPKLQLILNLHGYWGNLLLKPIMFRTEKKIGTQ